MNVYLEPGTLWWVREPDEFLEVEPLAELHLVTGLIHDRSKGCLYVYTASENGLGCWEFSRFIEIASSAHRVSESQR